MIKIISTNNGASKDITQLIQSVEWSGDDRQCCRTLQFSFLSSADDPRVPVAACQLGDHVQFLVDEALLFDGFIFTRQKQTSNSIIAVTCYDRGIYLKKNQSSYKFTNQKPEDIAAILCREFGITPGEIAVTGVAIARNFLGSSLYEILQTSYELAGEETGQEYQILFIKDVLHIVEKEKTAGQIPVIEAGGRMINASMSESVESMINQVAIYNKNDELVKPMVNNEEYIGLYGLMQGYLKEEEGEDNRAKARKILADNGIEQKITINNLGNIQHTSGCGVLVREPYNGLNGLFFIDSDRHSWSNGIYKNTLVLRFGKMAAE